MNIDISFPGDYEPNTIDNQQRMVDLAIKDFQEQAKINFERTKFQILNPREKQPGEMAKILETPNKLASIGNCYSIYKAHSDIKLPIFLKKKQERNQ